jgi:hypothetical protein
MHFELPEKVASSVKEFASHYVMIVVSILTALALEQVVVTIHEHGLGKYSSRTEGKLEVCCKLAQSPCGE